MIQNDKSKERATCHVMCTITLIQIDDAVKAAEKAGMLIGAYRARPIAAAFCYVVYFGVA